MCVYTYIYGTWLKSTSWTTLSVYEHEMEKKFSIKISSSHSLCNSTAMYRTLLGNINAHHMKLLLTKLMSEQQTFLDYDDIFRPCCVAAAAAAAAISSVREWFEVQFAMRWSGYIHCVYLYINGIYDDLWNIIIIIIKGEKQQVILSIYIVGVDWNWCHQPMGD